jgi:nucleotide-binding universal stress UspA family protein
MGLKTILVHLANDEDHVARLATAMRLAKRHGAHLIALYITRPAERPAEVAGRTASLAYMRESAAEAEARARAVESEFTATCEREGLSYDWVMEDSEHLSSLAQRAHAADLVIVSRGPDVHFEDRFRLRLSEELVLVTGLPILILPPGAPALDPGQRVFVCWKPTREAVRALRDSLPLLAAAKSVHLGLVNPDKGDSVAALEIQQYLSRHGIKAQTLDLPAQGSIGETLLAGAAAHGCDLIVSGAYGHTRLREVLTGGVTRSMLRHATVPLLLSH